MSTLVISNNSKRIGALEEMILPYTTEVKIVSYDSIPEIVECEKFDLIVLSGGTYMSVPKNREKLAQEFELIKNTTKPVLGICLGFEIIADVFGAELQYRTEKVSGEVVVETITDDLLVADKKSFTVHEAHKYYVDTLIGTPLVALAKSQWGIEILKHKDKPIYGFQFHPENQNMPNDGLELFKNWVEVIKK